MRQGITGLEKLNTGVAGEACSKDSVWGVTASSGDKSSLMKIGDLSTQSLAMPMAVGWELGSATLPGRMENTLHMGLCCTKLLPPAMAKGGVKAPSKQLWCTRSVLSLVFPANGHFAVFVLQLQLHCNKGEKSTK